METYEVISCPSTDLSYTNRAILSPTDKYAQIEHIAVRYPKHAEAFVFSVARDASIPRGKIAFNLSGRKWASLMVKTTIEAAPYKFEVNSQCLHTVRLITDFSNRQNAPSNLEFDTEDMARQFSHQFSNQALTVGQIFGFAYSFENKRIIFELKVKEFDILNVEARSSNIEIGLTTANTVFLFERAEGSDIKLIGGKASNISAPKLFNQDWDFANLGIGGLGEQFNTMFRRAFISRLFPPQLAKEMGEEHVRGILLYGPPGTGKTLIARQIGRMLMAREPKIVNGPELLDKYVGGSEANVRALFAEAEEEQKKMGINSGLHMIILYEIDSLCKSRGSSAGSSGVGDNVVNQLLSKIDGVDALHNVLLIGMTNRRDLIDEALLRPGRFEVQIEIGLPDKAGRLEIFKIHTKKMLEKGRLDPSVDLEELADRTKNYSGAEIAGLIRAARYTAVNRIAKIDSKIELDEEMLASFKVTRADFQYAMEHDVKPALGASEDQLKELARPMVQWDSMICKMQSKISGIIKLMSSDAVPLNRPYYVLLLGEPGSGLTTIAANMALNTKFPFIRVYQAESTAGDAETTKIQYMRKLFEDASRSELSCIVLDGLEVILDYCRSVKRFSNKSRAVLTSKKSLTLAKGRRMLVICTCSHEPFENDLIQAKIFNEIIKIQSLMRPEQVKTVLMDSQESGNSVFTLDQCNALVNVLGSIPFKIGIRELEDLITSATNDEPGKRVEMFIERMSALNLVVRKSRLDHQFGEITTSGRPE